MFVRVHLCAFTNINIEHQMSKFEKVMSGFKEIKIGEASGGNSSEIKKPTLTFKLQKSSPKLKTGLQGSVVKAFDDDDDVFLKKRTLSKPSIEETHELAEIDKNELKLSYEEPVWSGLPKDIYILDVLKLGVVINSFNLSGKNYYVVGSSMSCDIFLMHDTISEFHAILQFRKLGNNENEKGMYIYDLNSEHGTYLNGNRIKPSTYILLHGGYMISFGDYPRKYALRTSKDNEEKEAELSAGELQELKKLEAEEEKRIENERLLKESKAREAKESENAGISWGILEEVDRDSDTTMNSENSESDNEDLFLDNPEKALKDWFKWEGYDLEYETEDQGCGRYYCSIDIPLDPVGTEKTIEVNVTGDKMKAIKECALKACRFLNQCGFLKQASDEKKSTVKNWEEVDYYDSDEDNFVDRTGGIEKKRQQRMQQAGKLDKEIETHTTLLEKHSKIANRIKHLEELMALQKTCKNEDYQSDEYVLDACMTNSEIRDVKMELHNLRQEEVLVLNSINKSTSTAASTSRSDNITEKTKHGFRT